MQEFFLQHYVGHHPNVDFSDRISYHDVRWRFTPQNCAFRSAWNSLEALKTWWYTTLYQLPATANISLSLSLLLQAHSFCLNSKFQWNSIQPRVLPLFFVPGISVDTQIEGWGDPTSETKFTKNARSQMFRTGWWSKTMDNSHKVVATQIFFIFTPNLGEMIPILSIAYFSNGLVKTT